MGETINEAAQSLTGSSCPDSSESQLCVRYECGKSASVVFEFDIKTKSSFLFDLAQYPLSGIPSAILLCSSHSKNLKPPVGWSLTDKRSPVNPNTPMSSDRPTDNKPAALDELGQEISSPLLDRAFKNIRQFG